MPNLAMEAHKAAIDRVVEQALERAGVAVEDLDAVAVTVGPGLSLCLRVSQYAGRWPWGLLLCLKLTSWHSGGWMSERMSAWSPRARPPPVQVGTVKALQLAAAHGKPLVRVHHMEAHALVARMLPPGHPHRPQFPFLCLLVSGGHNLLVLVRGVGH